MVHTDSKYNIDWTIFSNIVLSSWSYYCDIILYYCDVILYYCDVILYYCDVILYSTIRKHITLTGLTMLRVKVRFLICLQINAKTCIMVFLIKKEDMDALLNDINGFVITTCECSGQCMHATHSIIAAQLVSAIEK